MENYSFTMGPQKAGRLRYLILTVGPTTGLMYLFLFLTEQGILPRTKALAMVYLYGPMVFMMVIAYFLIFRKNHSLEVTYGTITETDWLRKNKRQIQANEIHRIRRNFLGEILLLDADGKRLLCVEANMVNFDQFQQWLARHNLYESKE